MANMYFNKEFKLCSICDSPEYLYVDDVDAFIQECGDEWISDDVSKRGVYYWNDTYETWRLVSEGTEIDKKIRKIIEQIEQIGQTEPSKQGGNVFVGWNILITLDTGETIKTNSEPISIDEAQEAINILLKPSFFGKRIKKFEIVAE